ncbi:MAG: HD-like signal output (HDOD) protein [Pirellulaceae bacterium]|jgi:HD-like signal output (HDOD) protein
MSTATNSTILDCLDDLPELRPFPTAASRLLSACDDPGTDSKILAEIIQRDPGFAAKILQVANSSLYGCSGKIRTIDQAVVMLGFRSVKDIAISMAGAAVFANGNTASVEREQLWHHSLGCATVARKLATCIPGILPDEAFLAGIFHDVGKLIFFDLVSNEYAPLVAQHSRGDLLDAEFNTFGITHEELGIECGEDWGLSQAVNCSIGFHHSIDDAPDFGDLVALTSLADAQARRWGLGQQSAADLDQNLCKLGVDLVEESSFSFSEQQLEKIHAECIENFEEVRDICGG